MTEANMDVAIGSFTNLRDMGGLVCGAKTLRRGKLFRSSALSSKNRKDKQLLDSLDLDMIIDLRTPEEILEKPDYIPKRCEFINASVYKLDEFRYITSTKDTLKDILRLRRQEADILRQSKLRAYGQMPFAPEFNEIFRQMDHGRTIAFHCSEGKDRTGIAAMLIEFAFGRSEEQVRYEYLRSNQYFIGRNASQQRLLRIIRVDPDHYRNLVYCMSTHDELFDTALTAIRERYVDIPTFLREAHGISTDRIQAWKQYYLIDQPSYDAR